MTLLDDGGGGVGGDACDDTAPVVRILGTVSVDGAAGSRAVPGRLDRLLLVRLVLAAGHWVSVDAIVDALWPDEPPSGARNAAQVKVSRLRRVLGGDAGRLRYAQGAYRLAATEAETDLGLFVRAVGEAGRRMATEDHRGARQQLQVAAALWPGDPLAEFAADPVVAAERVRLAELHAGARETEAELDLREPTTRAGAIATLRAVLAVDPMRPRARELLMYGLDLTGRRGDALAVYDAGRRLYLQHGLEPPERLTARFEQLLAAERAATRRAPRLRHTSARAPDGLLDAARWLADDGDPAAGMQLAVRGVWWWWIGGRRGQARELLDDLIERVGTPGAASPTTLTARAWRAVLDSHSAQAALRLADGDATLRAAERPPWTQHDALAAVLIAERLFERGEHARAARLLRLAWRHYGLAGDEWGLAMCRIVGTRGRLLAGEVGAAYAAARAALEEFAGLGDEAGQVIALDVIGYCAEVLGDLAAADTAHRRALALARRLGSPEWEATQLTRIGNVATLRGRTDAEATLRGAAALSVAIGSAAITALCHNGRGVALQLAGGLHEARHEHLAALDYYRAADSDAGLAYTEARLALLGGDGSGAGESLATSALRRAVSTRDPRAIAHSLEAVTLTAAEPTHAASALGAADTLRAHSSAPLPDLLHPPLRAERESLERRLGSGAFIRHWSAGRRDPAGTARTLAQTG